jgi:hypothetical protein
VHLPVHLLKLIRGLFFFLVHVTSVRCSRRLATPRGFQTAPHTAVPIRILVADFPMRPDEAPPEIRDWGNVDQLRQNH